MSTAKLETALAEALPKLESAKKNSANPHFKSKYADLGSVIDAIRPVAEHGIWFRQATRECADGVEVETFYIGHGASLSAGVLHMPADKRNPQGFGSALTYARRYALQTAFGLATEDDDGNAASATEQPKRSARQEAKDAFPEGPAPNITGLRKMVDDLWQAVEDAEDYDALERLCTNPDNRAIMMQASRLTHPAHREIWMGDGVDNPGLRGLIERRKLELSDNILAAG